MGKNPTPGEFMKTIFLLIFPHFSKIPYILGIFVQKFIQMLKNHALILILHVFKNYVLRYRHKKPAKNGEEISIPEFWVGEKIRILA